MSQPFDILRRLQDYELLPPPEVVAGLRSALTLEMNRAQESQESGSDGINEGISIHTGCIERVGQLEIELPSFIRAAIESRLREKSPDKGSGIKKIFSLYPYRSAAACLILLIACWGIYRAKHTQPAATLAVTHKVNPALSETKPPVTQNQNAVSIDSAAEKKVAGNLPAAENTKTGSSGAKMVKLKQVTSFSIAGQGFPVVDNDLLVTFASFNYGEIPAFLFGNEDKEVKIHVDQYTNIVISRAMAATMKEMYQVKSGGKPTRKARKTREKLEEWKKKDIAHFDQSPGSNPLDPIDLAKFIFK